MLSRLQISLEQTKILGAKWNFDIDINGNDNIGQSKLKYERGGSPGANVIKLFTAVIYHNSTVILSFYFIKLYFLGNYCGMAVN